MSMKTPKQRAPLGTILHTECKARAIRHIRASGMDAFPNFSVLQHQVAMVSFVEGTAAMILKEEVPNPRVRKRKRLILKNPRSIHEVFSSFYLSRVRVLILATRDIPTFKKIPFRRQICAQSAKLSPAKRDGIFATRLPRRTSILLDLTERNRFESQSSTKI